MLFTHSCAYGCWILCTEDSTACNKHVSSQSAQFLIVCKVNSTVNLYKGMRTRIVDKLAQLLYLFICMGDEFLPPESRIYAHKQNKVDILYNILQYRYRGCWVQGYSGFHACIVNLCDDPVEVSTCFVVNIHDVCSQRFYLGYEFLRFDNHKVYVQRFFAESCYMF